MRLIALSAEEVREIIEGAAILMASAFPKVEGALCIKRWKITVNTEKTMG